jgi:hypothetical protein
LGDEIQKNGMGEECCIYGGGERFMQSLMGKSEGKKDNSKDTGVNGRIRLNRS